MDSLAWMVDRSLVMRRFFALAVALALLSGCATQAKLQIAEKQSDEARISAVQTCEKVKELCVYLKTPEATVKDAIPKADELQARAEDTVEKATVTHDTLEKEKLSAGNIIEGAQNVVGAAVPIVAAVPGWGIPVAGALTVLAIGLGVLAKVFGKKEQTNG